MKAPPETEPESGDRATEESEHPVPLDVGEIVRRVNAVPNRERTEAALADDVLTFCANMDERAGDWIALKAALRKAKVKIREWQAAVRYRRRELHPEEAPAHVETEADDRPEIVIRTDEHLTTAEAAVALAQLPDVYERSFCLVDVLRDQLTQAPTIRELPQPLVRDALSRACLFLAPGQDDQGRPMLLPAHPPLWCVQAIAARGSWPGVRALRAVAQTPMLRKNGTVLDVPGYDPSTGLLYEPNIATDPVPERPALTDVREALDRLFYVVKDVPFADACEPQTLDETREETRLRLSKSTHACAWLASVLTPFSRHAFEGPAPVFVYTANVRAAGKGLLKNIAGEIALGREMQFMTQATERDAAAEDRKRITALAISGEPMVVIDNIRAPLGNATLEAATTQTTWGERVLGESKVPRTSLVITWYATGNNVVLAGDMPRRCVMIHLDSPYAKPEDRADFTEPNLLGYVRANRSSLVWACLVLLRSWCALGMNDLRDPGPCGSFEGWSKIVRGAVINAGVAAGLGAELADPWAARGSADDDADDDAPSHCTLVDGWEEALSLLERDRATPGEVIEAMKANDEARDVARKRPLSPSGATFPVPDLRFKAMRSAIADLISGLRPGELPNAKQLGRHLAVHKNRSLPDGRRIVFHRMTAGRFYAIGRRTVPGVRPAPATQADPVGCAEHASLPCRGCGCCPFCAPASGGCFCAM